MDARKLGVVVDEEARLREKHQGLLQEYLVLQKECVLKKRKLKETNERKETLFDEIRFLKYRRNFLLKKQSQKPEQPQETIQSHKTDNKYNAESSRTYLNGSAIATTSTSGQSLQSRRPPLVPARNTGSGGKAVAGFAPLNLANKPKKLVANGKKAEKRKISWQDPLALHV